MKVLILGGTVFLGRAITQAAIDAGHEVTLFNRGKSGPDLFPGVEQLRGNRDGGLSALEGRKWDVAIDPSGYVPRIVRASAKLLADTVEHYTFISSISVYDSPVSGMDESAPVTMLEDETVEQITGETYGGLKVLCERAVEDELPGRAFNVRAGLIVGPHDPTDRFTYWPVRAARGGDMLVPPLDSPLQIIDVRDLAAWIIRMAEARNAGTYNATGPATPLTFGDMLASAQAASGNQATLIEASESFLTEQQVAPWSELPLWLPKASNGLMRVTIDRALDDGLTLRPLDETIRATLDWFRAERGKPGGDVALKSGIAAEKEQAVIAAWKQSTQNE